MACKNQVLFAPISPYYEPVWLADFFFIILLLYYYFLKFVIDYKHYTTDIKGGPEEMFGQSRHFCIDQEQMLVIPEIPMATPTFVLHYPEFRHVRSFLF